MTRRSPRQPRGAAAENGFVIETVARFVDWLEAAANDRQGTAESWYRGHPRPGLAPAPGVLRRDCGKGGRGGSRAEWERRSSPTDARGLLEKEISLNREFRRRAAFLLPQRGDLVEVYFLAEHHGLPTRLLDWTTNPLAALFFAVGNHPEVDGEVIVLRPGGDHGRGATLPDRGGTAVGVLPQHHPRVESTIGFLFGVDDLPAEREILFILPELRVARMLQQGACFTLHMPGTHALAQERVLRLAVPADRKPAIARALRRMGMSWATLFPDMDHVCRELRDAWTDAC